MDPKELLTDDERVILAAHCKATAGCRDDDTRAKALARYGWDANKVRFVGTLLAKLRRQGVYVVGIDGRGELVFATRPKSRLDAMMIAQGAEYERRGLELLTALGIGSGVLRRVEG
jgi:hypothetical protein